MDVPFECPQVDYYGGRSFITRGRCRITEVKSLIAEVRSAIRKGRKHVIKDGRSLISEEGNVLRRGNVCGTGGWPLYG